MAEASGLAVTGVEGSEIVAPGMLASHYAPGKPVRLGAVDFAADEYGIGFGAVVAGLMAEVVTWRTNFFTSSGVNVMPSRSAFFSQSMKSTTSRAVAPVVAAADFAVSAKSWSEA